MYKIEMLKDKVGEIFDIQPVIDQDIDLADIVIEQLAQNLDLCLNIPIVRVFSTIHKTGKSFYDYKMCIRLLNFYIGCKDIN